MPLTPRDIYAYLTDLTNSIQDPTIDVQKGPLAVLLYGDATEGARSEAFSAYLQSYFQLADPNLLRAQARLYRPSKLIGKSRFNPTIARLSMDYSIVFGLFDQGWGV